MGNFWEEMKRMEAARRQQQHQLQQQYQFQPGTADFSMRPGTHYAWGQFGNPMDPWNMYGQQAAGYDDQMRMVTDAIATFKGMPKFDANRAKRDVDSAFSMSMAQMPGISSNLKGMGVPAAEGTAALQASLPLMQARGQAYGDLHRDQINANATWLQQLMNLLGQRGNTMAQGFGSQQGLYNMILNRDMNS